MPRVFPGADSTDYFSQPIALAGGAAPLSFGCWVNLAALTANQVFFAIYDPSGNYGFDLYYENGTDMAAGAFDASSSAIALYTVSPSLGTWNYLAAVYASPTSRTVYFNNASGGDATYCVPPSLSQSYIGGTDVDISTDGAIAFPAFWKVALSPTDIASLAAGCSPRQVRPNGLIAYSRFSDGGATERDLILGTNWTLTGASSSAANPRIYLP